MTHVDPFPVQSPAAAAGGSEPRSPVCVFALGCRTDAMCRQAGVCSAFAEDDASAAVTAADPSARAGAGERGDRSDIGGGVYWRRYTPAPGEPLYELMGPDGGFVDCHSSTEAEARAFATALSGSSAAGGVVDPLVAYLRRQWAWSKETFGSALRTKGIVQHIRKELVEIEAEPHDLAEWVDVIILAMDGFWRHGGQPEDLLAAMQAKQDKNFARMWPDWRTMGEDQAIEHDRSDERRAAPAIRLREGKCYRSHEGKKVGPVYPSSRDKGIWYSRTKAGGGDWYDDGRALHGFPPDCPPHYDLVAEWEDAPASPAETKATLADATFDIDAPTHRVDAGAVAGDLRGVEAALDQYSSAITCYSDRQRFTDPSEDRAQEAGHVADVKDTRAAVLDAVHTLLTPAGDAAKLVDAYRTAVLDSAEADRCYYPDQASEDRCRQAERAEAAARLAIDARLAAKDRELDSLRRSGAATDGVREAVPAELRDAIDALLTDQRVRSALEREPRKDWLRQTPVNLDLLRAVSNARARLPAEDRARGAQGREASA